MSRLVLTDEETVTEVMPPDSALPTGVQAAASYIRELLLRPGRYRRKWEQYAERSRAGQVNQLAVAEVLAHYLWQHPRAKGDLDGLPRQLKDTGCPARARSATIRRSCLAAGGSRRSPCTIIIIWAPTECRSSIALSR